MRRLLLSLLSHHTLYLIRIDLHFLGVRLRNFFSFRQPARIKPDSRYLNLACGPHGLKNPGWFNLDGWPGQGIDYVVNLRKRLPFPEDRFDGAFCEHFFEHLSIYEREPFLAECLRVLKPGGTLRISVPDGGLYLERYSTDRAWMSQMRRDSEIPMDVVNDVFRQRYEHAYCYDAETLLACLARAGFVEAAAQKFGAGYDENLLIDQANRSTESLYVEGKKPGDAAKR